MKLGNSCLKKPTHRAMIDLELSISAANGQQCTKLRNDLTKRMERLQSIASFKNDKISQAENETGSPKVLFPYMMFNEGSLIL